MAKISLHHFSTANRYLVAKRMIGQMWFIYAMGYNLEVIKGKALEHTTFMDLK
jgi:hypothetical protein